MSKASDRLPAGSRRTFLVASSALMASGCFGSFGATVALYDWNKDVSDNKWLRWLVFLVLIIVPVYELFALADVLVLNTIEFFSGKNPISGSHAQLGDGRSVHMTATDDPNLVKHEIRKDGEVERTLYVRKLGDRELELLDERMRPAGRVRRLPAGGVEVLDGQGRIVHTLRPEQVQRAALSMVSGAAPSTAVAEVLDPGPREVLMASAR